MKTRATFTFVLLLALLPSSLLAQQPQLSPSEQAALKETRPTSRQAARHRRECGYAPKRTGKEVRVSPEVKLQIVTLPRLQFLPVISMNRQAGTDEQFEITRFKDLPNGGIAGMDFCGVMQLATYAEPTPGAKIQHIALRLRENLDLARDYPTTSVEIFRRRQYFSFAAGRYAKVDLGDRLARAWHDTHAPSWSARDPERMGIVTEETALIPIR